MKKFIQVSVVFVLIISLSCGGVKEKTKEVAERAKEKSKEVAEKVAEKTMKELEERTQKFVDKVFPPFDHDQPDTENNKKRFVDFLKVDITPDVKNIYCFDDAIGIDFDYMFAFSCNETTASKIIDVHDLALDPQSDSNGFGMQHDFEWWDKDRIKELEKYSWNIENQYFKYFWFDPENEKAYFFEFSM